MHLQRPRCVARMAGGAALLVRKRVDAIDTFRRDDFAIDELAPHRRAVRRRHPVVICPADAQIHFGCNHFEALGAPPLLHVLRVGKALPHKVAWCIEHPRDDKRGAFRGGRHRHSYSVGVFSYCCSYFGSTMTIQFTPNLSCVMPKRGEKNVLSSGMMTVPPSDNPLKSRSASARVLGIDRQCKAVELRIAGIASVRGHHSCLADLERGVHHLVLVARRAHRFVGAVLPAHQHADFSAERFFVKLDRFIAAAVEEQIGLHLHNSFSSMWSD